MWPAEQLERTTAARKLARERLDYEKLGAVAAFLATVNYLVGRPDELRDGRAGCRPGCRATGQPYYRQIYCCLAYAGAFLQGDFDGARQWADETLKQNDTFGDDDDGGSARRADVHARPGNRHPRPLPPHTSTADETFARTVGSRSSRLSTPSSAWSRAPTERCAT